jgi:hypothetical protein
VRVLVPPDQIFDAQHQSFGPNVEIIEAPVSPRDAGSDGDVGNFPSNGPSAYAQGRFTLALDSKNFFIPAENFVQLHDKDASSHGPFDRTTELRALGIGTLVGAITMGNPGGDIEPVTRSS